jgi:hypothetical protein
MRYWCDSLYLSPGELHNESMTFKYPNSQHVDIY